MKNKYLITISVILLALIAAIYSAVVFTQNPDYDTSYNASVSKNLASGLGYSTSYDEYYFNNFEITTGPTILVVGGLFVKVFGNVYWIGIITLLIIILLMAVLFYVDLKLFTKSLRKTLFKITLFVTLMFILISPESFTQLYGEIPATLLVIIASLLYFSEIKNKNIYTGIIFALAFLTKSIMVILLVPILMDSLLKIFAKNSDKKSSIKKFSTLVISAAVLIISSSILLGFLNPNNYPKKDGGTEFFLQNSGITPLLESSDKIVHVLKNIYRATNSFIYNHGFLSFTFVVITTLILFYLLFKRGKNLSDSQSQLLRSLSVGMALFGAWWFLISIFGWIRHVMPALVIFCYVIATVATDQHTKFSIPRIHLSLNLRFILLIPFIFLTLNVFPKNYDKYFYNAFVLQPVERINQLNETKNFLIQLKEIDAQSVLVGCGDWYTARDLEYVLDSSLNFHKCESYLEELPVYTNVYLVRNEHYLYLENLDKVKYAKFTDMCDQNILYQKGVYKVSKCN